MLWLKSRIDSPAPFPSSRRERKHPMRNCSLLMQSAPRRRTAPRAIAPWAAAGLIAVLVISAAEARASCGDYVHVTGDRAGGASLTHAEHRSIDVRPFSRRATPDPVAPAPPTPSCQGPNCRRQLPGPFESAPPVPPAGALQWACWQAAAELTHDEFASRSLALSLHPLAGYWRAIDRPPRTCG